MTELNVSLNLHPVYVTSEYIPDYLCESFSRIRLMSHNLKIDTSRWSSLLRKARVSICDSGTVQTENHLLIECKLIQCIRLRYSMLNFQDLNRLFIETDHTLLLYKSEYTL